MEDINSNTTKYYKYVYVDDNDDEDNNYNLDDDSTLFDYHPSSYVAFWFRLFNFLNLLNRITIGFGFLLILIVMIAVFSQVKKGQDSPVYVINLLVSDIIQLCFRIPLDLNRLNDVDATYLLIVDLGVIVSVGFMVCISCERYLVITKPLWYRFRRKNKTYVVVCIVVWILPLLYPVLSGGIKEYTISDTFFIIILLLSFPVFIFFLVGTIKALSGALGVPEDEKRRIVAIQVAVLIIYSLLYLPMVGVLFDVYGVLKRESYVRSLMVDLICIFLSPLADTTLYLFTRKTILDKFLASICSCKISNNQETIRTETV